MDSTTLSIIVKLKDEASAAMQGLGDNLKKVGESMTSVGKTMTTDITLPLVGFATYAVKGAMDFQQAMTLVQTQAGASASEVADLSKQVMTLAQSSQQGPTELADGLYHLISLGLNAQDAMNALKVASEGAAVGQEDLEDVTNALGGAISSGIKGTSDYAGTMGALDAIIGAGNMKMGDLTAALGTGILPAARSAGLSLSDVGAALATMTDNGVPATDAATRLRMTFSLLAAPTSQAQKALASVGISSTQLAQDMRQPNGLLVAVQDLKQHLEDSGKSAVEQNAVIAQAFGGGRTSSSIETLIEETDKLSQKYTYLAANTDKFSTSAKVEAQTWTGQLQNMNANLEVFRDTVGTSLLQIANQVFPIITNALQDLLNAWNRLSPGMQKAIIIFAGVAAALGPILVIVGTLIGSIATIITSLGTIATVLGITSAALLGWIAVIALVIAAVVLVAYEIYTHWNQIKQVTLTVWQSLEAFFITTWDSIKSAFTTSWNAIKAVFSDVWKTLVEITEFEIDLIVGIIVLALDGFDPKWREHWQAISSFFTDLWNTIKAFLKETWNWITSLFNTSLSGIQDVWNAVWGGVSSFFIGIWDGVKGALSSALGFLRSEIGTFVSWAEGVFAPVQAVVSAIGGAASGFMSAIKTGAGAVANVGSQITHFATGGIVNGPTIALVGEAGPEAIIPLSSFNNGMSLARGGSAGGATIIVNINGGNYLDAQGATMIANQLARQVVRQVRVANYSR